MIYTVTAWQRRASSHLPGSSHAHISNDYCKCSSVPLFSTEFTCQEGFARFHRLGPEPLPTSPAARAKLLEVPPPRILPDIPDICCLYSQPSAACTTCPLHSPVCSYGLLQLGGKLRCVRCTQKNSHLHCSTPEHWSLGAGTW